MVTTFIAPTYKGPTTKGTTEDLTSKIFPYSNPSSTSITPNNYLSGITQYPERTTIAESLPDIQSLLPNQGKWENIAGLDVNQFGQVNGLGSDYYKSLVDAATKNLKDQYYGGSDSLAKQNELLATKRGILGTGIEGNMINELNKDFGSQLADVTGQISRLQAEKDLELALANRNFGLDVAKTNLENTFKNREGELGLSELGLKAAGDEAATSTEFATDKFKSEVELEKILNEALTEEKKLDADRLANLINLYGNRDIATTNRNDILSEIFKDYGIPNY